MNTGLVAGSLKPLDIASPAIDVFYKALPGWVSKIKKMCPKTGPSDDLRIFCLFFNNSNDYFLKITCFFV